MDAHLENHLPLITARIVFAPGVLPPPPTITRRMTFPEIDIDVREESPRPEPLRARTPLTRFSTLEPPDVPSRSVTIDPRRPRTPLRNATPGLITVPKKAVVDRSSEPPSQNKVEFVSSGSDSDSDMDVDGGEDELEIGDDHGLTGLILKPKGDVSWPGRGGYNLNKALGWNQKTYDSVLLLVTRLAKERLDVTLSYRGQSKKKVAQLAETVCKEFNFMKDYAKDWPVHDMLKTYLKNTSQSAQNTKGKETAEKIDQIVNGPSSKVKDS